MDISNDAKLVKWFDGAELSEKTRENYLLSMKSYCQLTGKTPDELIREAIAEIKAGKLPSEATVGDYIVRFKKSLKEKGLAETTQSLSLAAVRSFYTFYDIVISNGLKKKRNQARSKEENQIMLTREDVIKLITNAKSLRDRAIILCMATSGMARREILNLKYKDISFTEDDIGIIQMRRQKNKVDFITFISPEAVYVLKNYLEEKTRIAAQKKEDKVSNYKHDSPYVFVDVRGEQLDKTAFARIFEQLAEQLGFTNGENQIICKSHNLRKFCSTTLENAGMPMNKIKVMLAHSQSSTDFAYFKKNIDKFLELYKTFLPHLTFEKEIHIAPYNERLSELEKENTELKTYIEKQEAENKKRDALIEFMMQRLEEALPQKK